MIGSGGYVKGDRVRFLAFGEPDPHSRLTAGTEGTVVHVDDLGTVHVQWDDGGRLGMIVDPPAGQPPDRIEPAASNREVAAGDLRRVRNAMRSGEWLRTQWIARVAFDLGRAPWHPDHQRRIWRALSYLYVEDEIERRPAHEWKHGEVGGVEITFPVSRWEWRLPHDTDAD